MRHGSLFSGIGGFDLASEWMGWENVFHCEWNEFGKKVLKYYWPKAISYDDITKTDFTIHRGNIEILTGGFPCQPYSQAGKRLGKEDDRHLWPEMLRAIREIQPTYVVGENVFGLVNWNGGLVFDEVQADLEAEGYEVQPFILPACAVNAPHRRDRVWFVAYASSKRRVQQRNGGALLDGNRECKNEKHGRQQQPIGIGRSDEIQNATNPDCNGQQRCNCKHEVNASEGGQYAQCDISEVGEYDTNAINERLQRSENVGEIDRKGENRIEQPARLFRTAWQNFPTQSPICNGDDGLSCRLDGITFSKWRNESIKAGGNAIVPQVVYEIFKVIEQMELQ